MTTFHRSSPMPVSAETLAAWHAQPAAFERLAPPWEDLRILSRTGGLTEGRLRFALQKGPVSLEWVADHSPVDKGLGFVDTMAKGPFARWRHTHRFTPNGDGTSLLDDSVDYALPGGPLGALFGGAFAESTLARMFAFRQARTRLDLERHARFADQGPLRILVSGASGLIGRNLVAFLRTGGHEVVTLVRREAKAGEIRWDPKAGQLDPAAVEGFDAVVHLAGAGIAEGRWTAARKAEILSSRVESTTLLARTLAGLARKPRVFVSASGAGFYGNRGDVPLAEDASAGTGYLADVCIAWEASTQAAVDAGIRTVQLRTGVVLTPAGGALAQMLPPFRLGLGGPIGPGDQVMSWIGLEDIVGVYHHALFTESLAGPVNAVAPQALSSAEFAQALGRVLRRPAILPLPGLAVEAAFGEMGTALLLEGARLVPAKLEATGFRFAFPTAEAALAYELGEPLPA